METAFAYSITKQPGVEEGSDKSSEEEGEMAYSLVMLHAKMIFQRGGKLGG